MVSIVEAPLADLCREADPATVVDFAAAVYEARGWVVDRHTDWRFVASDGDRERQVTVAHPDDSPAGSTLGADADTVVTVAGADVDAAAGDAETVGPEALREQLAYAVDRPVARRLLDEHFDWPAEGPSAATPGARPDNSTWDSADDDTGTAVDRFAGAWRPSAGTLCLLVGAVLLLAVAGGVAVPTSVVGDQPSAKASDGGPPDAPTDTPTPTATARPTETAESDTEQLLPPSAAEDAEIRESETLPPGVNQSGALTPRTLAEAHNSALANTSYRLSLTYREFVDGRPTGVYTETVRVENATRYRVSVTSRGEFRTNPLNIANGDVYADGSIRYERTGPSSAERGVLLSYDRFLDDSTLYLLWFLDVRRSTIADYRSDDAETDFYVVTEGNPYPSITDTAGAVVVTTGGLVEHARWSYDISGTPSGDDNVSAVLELRVSDVGSTTVQSPDWVDPDS